MKKATISDVAKLAGVSIKTVSRVANGEANVRDDTRRKVDRAIEALDYQPDEHARQLAARRRADFANAGQQPEFPRNGEPETPRSCQAFARTDDPLLIDWA